MFLKKKKTNVRGRIVYLGKSKNRRRDYKKMLKIIAAVFLFLCLFGAVGYGIFCALRWDKLALAAPEIRTDDAFVKQEAERVVREYMNEPEFKYFKKSNYFLFSEQELANLLTNISPKVRAISVDKKWPRDLTVSVELKQRAGMWCQAALENKKNEKTYTTTGCFYFDENGFLFEKDVETVNSFLLLVKDTVSKDLAVGQTLAQQKTLKYIMALHKEFTERVGFLAEYFLVEDPSYEDLTVFSSEGYTIKVNVDADPKTTVSNFKDIMEKLKGKQILYLDLRIPDRVYYKLK
jgi:cell division septal protein FtsQ